MVVAGCTFPLTVHKGQRSVFFTSSLMSVFISLLPFCPPSCLSLFSFYFSLFHTIPSSHSFIVATLIGMRWYLIVFIFKFYFKFEDIKDIALQYCIGFYHTTTWITYKHMCPLHPEPPPPIPFHPSGMSHTALSQAPRAHYTEWSNSSWFWFIFP